MTSDERERIKLLEWEKRELKRANEILRLTLAYFAKEGDMGLFVTSGRFTSGADRFARDYNKHVKLIDIDTFIYIWLDFYNKADNEDKKKLQLQSINYLGTAH
jgi:restriction system protein